MFSTELNPHDYKFKFVSYCDFVANYTQHSQDLNEEEKVMTEKSKENIRLNLETRESEKPTIPIENKTLKNPVIENKPDEARSPKSNSSKPSKRNSSKGK